MGDFIKWPAWLPYPISWARASGNLFLWWSLTTAMLEAVARHDDYALNHCRIDEFGRVDCTSDASQAVLLLFYFLVNLVFQAIAVTITHHLVSRLRGKSRGWFPRWPSWREGVNGSIAIFFGGIVMAIAGILFVVILPKQVLVPAMLTAMLVVNAYLHQYDYRVRERRAARSLAKRSQTKKKGGKGTTSPSVPANSTPPPPPDPIEQELNQMRADLGLNQMRRRQKPPGNSQ